MGIKPLTYLLIKETMIREGYYKEKVSLSMLREGIKLEHSQIDKIARFIGRREGLAVERDVLW